jgi:hypothetical protein
VQLDCSRAYLVSRDFRRGGALTLDPSDSDVPCEALALGTIVPDDPVPFRVQERRLLGDFAPTSWAGLFTVSPKVQRALTRGGFSGWSTFPICVEGPMAESLAGYAGLAVTGRSGPIDDSLSARILRPGPSGRPAPHRLGLYPEPDSWDGSDIFTPTDSSVVCVVELVRNALVEADVTGAVLDRMSDVADWIWDE